MDILQPQTPFARMVGDALEAEPFTLVDVGCGGGLAHAWRAFEPHLRALGLDSDGHEMARLQSDEANPGVTYRAAMIDGGDWKAAGRDPWARLAIGAWKAANAILPAYSGGAATAESLDTAATVSLSQAVSDAGLGAVDFLKLDVDGPDFGILRTLGRALSDWTVLGVGAEVNFIGSGDADENSFHNTDGWLRRQGFDLFDLSLRRYANAALPGRTRLPYPAETHIGRLFQGDAVYFRDLCAPQNAALAAKASPEQLIKLAALFSLFGLPDCAAEVLTAFGDRIAPILNIQKGLDLLAAQAQPDAAPVSYARYMQAYAEGDRYFRLQDGGPEVLRGRASPADGDGAPCAAFDLAKPVLHGTAQCKPEGDEVLAIRSGDGRWSYAVEFPIDRAAVSDDAYLRLTIEAEVSAGAIGVGLLNLDRISFSEELTVAAGEGVVRLEIVSPSAHAVAGLMVRNHSADDAPAVARLRLASCVSF